MNAMSCAEVQEQLDLLAAGACDPATRALLERHMQNCPPCAARYAESQRLLGLLDLHWNQAAVARLQRRIEQQARPQRRLRFVPAFVRGYVAAAAVLLMAVGLVWWLGWPNLDGSRSGPQIALVVHANESLRLPAVVPGRAFSKNVEAMPAKPLAAKSGDALRRELLEAQREGKLPPPPAVALRLTLVNNSKRVMEVRVGDADPMLSLEIEGEGVLRVPVPEGQAMGFLQPETRLLEPGQQHDIFIGRLVAGSPGKVEYIYLTEPGEYRVTVRLRVTVDGRESTLMGGPVPIHVQNGP
jgi:hypothetical protein